MLSPEFHTRHSRQRGAARALQIQLPFHFGICFDENLEAAVQQEGTWTHGFGEFAILDPPTNLQPQTSGNEHGPRAVPLYNELQSSTFAQTNHGDNKGCSPTFPRCSLFGLGIDPQCPVHCYPMRLRKKICNQGLALVLLQQWQATIQTHTSRMGITPYLWKFNRKTKKTERLLDSRDVRVPCLKSCF